jgi:hypothetical protein
MDEGDEHQHKEARPGDLLICPFECDVIASSSVWRFTGQAGTYLTGLNSGRMFGRQTRIHFGTEHRTW